MFRGDRQELCNPKRERGRVLPAALIPSDSESLEPLALAHASGCFLVNQVLPIALLSNPIGRQKIAIRRVRDRPSAMTHKPRWM